MIQRGNCRSCDMPIIWARTEYGNLIPLDAEPNKPKADMALVDGVAKKIDQADLFTEVYAGDKYLSHWASCPKAHEWRRSAKKP
jgi:hypothetical protein